jgi:hypothetical protein
MRLAAARMISIHPLGDNGRKAKSVDPEDPMRFDVKAF